LHPLCESVYTNNTKLVIHALIISHNKHEYMKIQFTFLLIICAQFVFAQSNFELELSEAAQTLTSKNVTYDPSYFSISYPNGDIPSDKGVCTDVVIRAYRIIGVDLQKEVHEDMLNNFHLYPKSWGLSKPDKNIDHRRVPNLMTYFSRFGKVKPITKNTTDYTPGDIVCWDLGGGVTHIGLVVNKKSLDNQRYLVVHNIGGGQVLADCLFDFKIIGHYAYAK